MRRRIPTLRRTFENRDKKRGKSYWILTTEEVLDHTAFGVVCEWCDSGGIREATEKDVQDCIYRGAAKGHDKKRLETLFITKAGKK